VCRGEREEEESDGGKRANKQACTRMYIQACAIGLGERREREEEKTEKERKGGARERRTNKQA
jgi:hypothetical protein